MAKLVKTDSTRPTIRVDAGMLTSGILSDWLTPDERIAIAQSLGDDWYDVKLVISWGERNFAETGRGPMALSINRDDNTVDVKTEAFNASVIQVRMLLTYLAAWSHDEKISETSVTSLASLDARAVLEVINRIHRGQRVQTDAPLPSA